MKKAQRLLMALYCSFLLVAAVFYVCGEFVQADMAFLSAASRQSQFVCSTVMTLLTIGLLPLSLRLFRFRRVHRDLVSRRASALACWGSLRLVCMGVLLVANTLLYYAFAFASSYGYLAVVALLCMPFVVPTTGRCLAEVEPASGTGAPAESTNAIPDNEEAYHSHSQL